VKGESPRKPKLATLYYSDLQQRRNLADISLTRNFADIHAENRLLVGAPRMAEQDRGHYPHPERLQIAQMPNILGNMLDPIFIGQQVAERRKSLKLSQAALARKAAVSRATLDALETDARVRWAFQSWVNCTAPHSTN
jgi:DNA-binding XRE family transcriptional regulator